MEVLLNYYFVCILHTVGVRYQHNLTFKCPASTLTNYGLRARYGPVGFLIWPATHWYKVWSLVTFLTSFWPVRNNNFPTPIYRVFLFKG